MASLRVMHAPSDWGLGRTWLMVSVTIGTVFMTIWLYTAVPKGFLSEQDTGLLRGTTIASPGISFEAIERIADARGRCRARRPGCGDRQFDRWR